MAQFTVGQNRMTFPPFIAHKFDETMLLPGGGRLDITANGGFLPQMDKPEFAGIFKDSKGKIRLPAGLLVVRSGTDRMAYADTLPTANSLPAIPATGVIPTSPMGPVKNPVGTFAKGFRLAEAADFANGASPAQVYLTAFDVEDAMNNPDIELILPGTLIYINWLPYWPEVMAGLQNSPKWFPLEGAPIQPQSPDTGEAGRAKTLTDILWPAEVQAAIARLYGVTYGREVV